MSLRRIGRVVRGRWALLLALALVAPTLGYFGATLRNRTIRPAFEAQAFLPLAESSDSRSQQAQPAQQIRAAVDRAIEVNADLLSRGGANIAPDQETFEVVFSARAREPAQATARAVEMRSNYVIAEFGAIEIEGRMDLILAEAIRVSETLAALQPPPPVAPPEPVLSPEQQARLDFLLIQVDALKGESARLVGELVLAETGDSRAGSPEDIQEQIANVNQKLADLYVELETMPGFDQSLLDRSPSEEDRSQESTTSEDRSAAPGSQGSRTEISIPDDESNIGPGWQVSALETRYATLQTNYQTLFLGTLTGDHETLEPPIVTEVTPSEIPPVLAGGGGLLAGALVGALLLFVEGRVRQPAWVGADLPLTPAWEVPVVKGGRKKQQRLTRNRRRAIQQLRSSLITAIESRSGRLALSMSGLRVPRRYIHELARDVASALGDVDRVVLVIDLDSGTDQADDGSKTSLAGLLALARGDAEAARSELKQLVVDSSEEAAPVHWLPAGQFDTDPVDALQRRPFDELLSQAGEMVDLVVIISSEFDEVLSRALFQRVEGVIPVGRVGKTRERDFSRLASILTGSQAKPMGSVLLSGANSDPDRQHRRFHFPKFRRPHGLRPQALRRPPVAALSAPPQAEEADEQHQSVANGAVSLPMTMRRKLAKARVRGRVPTSRWRVLPDFLIIGTQRGGTSSLYKYLGQHPMVRPSLRKETEYFSSKFANGEDWYRAHFPIGRSPELANGGRKRLAFEADPDYLLDPRAAQRAYDLVPEAKIVVLLREPGTRAISHHAHNVRLGLENLSLREALEGEDERLDGELERMLNDPAYPGKPFQKYSYATRGFYAEQLKRWLDLFPIESFYAAKSEDLFSQTNKVYADLIGFLGLPSWQPKVFRNYSYQTGADRVDRGADPVVAELLEARFEPHNRLLTALLHWDLHWNPDPESG